MSLVVVAIVAFFASIMTFFSGFGLNTLLLPVFTLLMPVPSAVTSVALVHFSNNLFKLTLLWRKARFNIVWRFALLALPFAALGAYVLKNFSDLKSVASYTLFEHRFVVMPVGLAVGALMVLFAIFEWLPSLRSRSLKTSWIFVGGAMSGFFGGLSGHQGALRSIFLLRFNLAKEAFLATGVVIAVLIDVVRLSAYGSSLTLSEQGYDEVIVVAILSAIAGAVFGKYFLRNFQIEWIRAIVCVALVLIGSLLMAGLL